MRALGAFARANIFLLQGVKCASPHHLQQWCALYPGHDAKRLLGVLYTWYEQLPEFRGVRVRRDDARGGVQRLLPLWRDCLIDVPVDFAELRKDDNALYFVHDNSRHVGTSEACARMRRNAVGAMQCSLNVRVQRRRTRLPPRAALYVRRGEDGIRHCL